MGLAVGVRSLEEAEPQPFLLIARSEQLRGANPQVVLCLLYTSDAADERSSVDLGGRRIIKKTKKNKSKSLSFSKRMNTDLE